jgi:16S rRNA (cytosine967-C5)-methyltransferase
MDYDEETLAKIALSMQKIAPLDIRVNIIKTSMKQVLEYLDEHHIKYQATKISPYGIRLHDKNFIIKNKLFLDGWFEVQDESSQIATMLLAPKRGEMIVDFCAGSGGKTLAIGMLMRNSGRIYAFDINEKRLNNLFPRLKKSGLSNIYPSLINNENDIKIKRLHNKIDRVLVDAPCSGLGTLRRNPDLKFRQSRDSISSLNQQQLSILNSASRLLKVNVIWGYATCSILRCENQDIINKFLESNKNFALLNYKDFIDNRYLNANTNYLQLLPHIHDTDGFFIALLKRVS